MAEGRYRGGTVSRGPLEKGCEGKEAKVQSPPPGGSGEKSRGGCVAWRGKAGERSPCVGLGQPRRGGLVGRMVGYRQRHSRVTDSGLQWIQEVSGALWSLLGRGGCDGAGGSRAGLRGVEMAPGASVLVHAS